MLAVLIITGCDNDSYYVNSVSTKGAKATVALITEVNGCSINEVRIQGNTPNLYLSICKDPNVTASAVRSVEKYPKQTMTIQNVDNTNSTTGQESKPSIPEIPGIEFSTNEKKILEQADKIHKKYMVLDKLSEEDKALLGFQTTKQ